jgi:hypothetical protein
MSVGLVELVLLSLICVGVMIPIGLVVALSLSRGRKVRDGGSRRDGSRGS